MPEYKETPSDDIMCYIERTPSTDACIKGMNKVDESIHHARIEFDSLFLVKIPGKDGTFDKLYEESAMDLLGVEEELRPTIMKDLLHKND